MPATEHDHTGVIAEVRDDSFSVRTDDQGVLWFMITPEFKESWSGELVTGNRVTVSAKAGATADKMDAISLERATETADLDVDVDVDDTDVNAEFDTDLDTDTQIADTDSDFRDDDADYDTDTDSDELPRTASSLPAIGSLGLLALLGAAVVAFARRF
jgi:hypothetical protein